MYLVQNIPHQTILDTVLKVFLPDLEDINKTSMA